MSATASDSFSQFEFIRNIGKGSYGEVTLSRHKRDRKQYVLKKINVKKASARERRAAEQEAKLLSKLKHPNIVSYKDSFEKDGFLYIAMQFCEGGDLYNKLKEQRGTLLDERQLVEWFVQIAMAMQYMHERNILHRDLKTQNIFLTKSKIIKVGDLGIARVLDSSSDMATTLIGTPYYMSPELFSNKPYNHKSDVWALGCCVYEMMTLKHAFNAKDMNSLVYKILRGKMPPMPKQYSQELVSLLRLMLHQDPAKRPTVNRILRDAYIKKNIAIFLEETKQSRRPASSARSRPSSARSVSSVSSVSSVQSQVSQVSHQGVDVPDSSRSSIDSERSAVDSARSASQVEVSANGSGDPGRPVPNQRHKPESRKPDLGPIYEGKMVVDLKEDPSDGGDTLKAVEEHKPASQQQPQPAPASSPTRDSHHRRKKKSILSKQVSHSANSINSGIVRELKPPPAAVKKSSAAIFENPKPVEKSRPLPPPPAKMDSEGLPQRRREYTDPPTNEAKSSSSSGSKDDNFSLGDETPRSLPNMSAREKRRRNNNTAQSCDRPNTARVRLEQVPDSSKSTVITKSERKQYEAAPLPARHRQPSIADDSSSSDEDTLKENDNQRRNKQQNRENKEMNNFISLLDTTLHLNKDDDRSEEEELVPVMEKKPVVVTSEETPRIPKSSSMPSVDTLCNADRLMARIQLLHSDCIKGVGWPALKDAYEILGRIEEDEVEPKLVALMGKDKFDLYAGKIWQLKFCEDMARIGIPS